MIKGIGIDIESLTRLQLLLIRYDTAALQTIFTAAELARAEKASFPSQYLAMCFSIKEAMSKALGTGFEAIDWNEIDAEVQAEQINVTLSGKALQRARALTASRWMVNGSVCQELIMITVVVI